MNYVIKSPREGWYLTEFNSSSGTVKYGKIRNAKVYCTKEEAQQDLNKIEPCGQRVVAFTKIGTCKPREEASSRKIDRIIIPRIKRRESGINYH